MVGGLRERCLANSPRGGRDRVGAWQECRLGDQGMMGGRRTQSSDCYGRALVHFFTCRAHARRWQFKASHLAPLFSSLHCIALDRNNAYNAICGQGWQKLEM